MPKPAVRVGLIGYAFMGRAHSNAYRQVNKYFDDLPYEIEMHTICGRTPDKVQHAAAQLGWQHAETDWRRVIENPAIDVIDVSTPGDSHAEITIAAAQAGKTVWCEKPIGNTLAEAEAMAAAVANGGRMSAVFHNYRFAPAIAHAKKMIEAGKIGQIFHYRATYLQDWIADPAFPWVWRLDKDLAGSGSLGDIGSHVIDLGRHLVGEFTSLSGKLKTFVPERPDGSGGKKQVTVDDAAIAIAEMEGGTLATIEATRFAPGRRNYNRIEINGSKGSLVFNMERMNELEYYNAGDPEGLQGFRTINVTESAHEWAAPYWPSGHIIGYEHTFINLVAHAIRCMKSGQRMRPDMEDGLRNQRVLDAWERSNESGQWVKI
ncbi:MAG: Gfo/Idh/MocA family oxidoreductase [Fimbriimonadaceae bacterium]|nr:Gfo/Idh/MocA family oxidoreductase [Fimbriimonadaceae bacterium]